MSPGSGNTRALAPAGQHEAPLIVQASIDALKLAYRVALDDIVLAELAARLDEHEACEHVIDGEKFELHRMNTLEPRFRLVNATKTIVVGRDFTGFPVQVDFRALHLRTQPLEAVIAEGARLARRFAVSECAEVRVWRVDLCVDATNVTFDRNDEENCVTRARGKVRFQAPEKVHTRKRGAESPVTGLTIGPGNEISVRIYDKTEELFAVHGRDSEKTRTELAVYRAAGWNGVVPVWRVEVQYRGSRLRHLGAGTPEQLAARLNALWHYAVGSPNDSARAWVRFVRRDASRIERCSTDERWRAYQGAHFSGEACAERVDGSNGGVAVEQMLGDVLSCLAARQRLPEVSSEQSIREILRGDFATAAELVLLEPRLLDDYPRRRGAVRARHSRPLGKKASP